MIEGDAMKLDEREIAGDGAHVVANLPYNIGTALLLKWLGGEWPPWWRSLTLMFQKEVAERIVAAPGSDAYGRLSIAAQWRSRPRIAMTVGPLGLRAAAQGHVGGGAHRARAMLRPESIRRCMERLTEAAFGQRRKMLRSSLKRFPRAIEALSRSGSISSAARKRSASQELVALANALMLSWSWGCPAPSPTRPSARG